MKVHQFDHNGVTYFSLREFADAVGIGYRSILNRWAKGDRGDVLARPINQDMSHRRTNPREVRSVRCLHCKQSFATRRPNQMYCGSVCATRAQGKRRTKASSKARVRQLTPAEIWEVKKHVSDVALNPPRLIRLDVQA